MTSATPATAVQPSVPRREALRVSYLDGMRGIAALFVVVAHALNYSVPEAATAAGGVFSTGSLLDRALYQAVESAIIFSRYAVVLFIVISGASLMLPVARSGTGQLPKGLGDYVRRRARRILPPYYAALAASLLLLLVVPGLADADWSAMPAFDLDVLLSHLLLVHNWSPDWAYRINPPLWTIPIEWQIYFVFPLVLLPVWRRFGSVAAALVGFAIGLGVYFGLGPERAVQSAPWFLGLFALGMLAATYGFSTAGRARPMPVPLPLAILGTLAFFVVISLAMRVAGVPFEPAGWVTDIAFGLATALFIVYAARAQDDREARPLAVRAFELAPVVGLGLFSYSLYLMHAPIVMIVAMGFDAIDVPAWTYFVVVVVAVAVAVVVTYLFHLAFERPFMPAHARETGASPLAMAVAALRRLPGVPDEK